jgi:hypothetical protein
MEAESAAASIRSLGQLREAFYKYSHCDDGSVAEGFSEASTSIIASQWEDVRRIDAELGFDMRLREFLIRHIDATTPLDRLDEIKGLSGRSCPNGSEIFCADVNAAAKRAIQEATEAH